MPLQENRGGIFGFGLRCIAAVVYNDCSEPLAAISLSGMTSRITDERLPVLGCIVRSVAAELTVVLGGVTPPVAETVRQGVYRRANCGCGRICLGIGDRGRR